MVRFWKKPFKQTDTHKAISMAVSPYGTNSWNNNLFYSIDYVAGFESKEGLNLELNNGIFIKTVHFHAY